MDEVRLHGKMVVDTMENGVTVKPMVMELWITPMAIDMKGCGKMVVDSVKVHIISRMEVST